MELEERKRLKEIVDRLAIAMAEKNNDPILRDIKMLTESTRTCPPRSAEDLDKDLGIPAATHSDGGRYYSHIRNDGKGQIDIIWPDGRETVYKFSIPDSYLDTRDGTPRSPEFDPADKSNGEDRFLMPHQIYIAIALVAFSALGLIREGGHPTQLRSFDPEVVWYGLAGAAGSCVFIFIAAVIGSVIAGFQRRPRRIAGWMLVFISSVIVMYMVLWFIPPPHIPGIL